MKNFEIIKNELYCVKEAGFMLDLESERESNFPASYSEGRKNRKLDSFCDLDGAALCKDENGDFYAVDFNFETTEPMVWQKLRKA